jgi:hypothetical protein
VLALVAMLWAHRRGLRVLWFSGAGLMAAVVVKLFLVDLAKVGGIERIVSFIAVGVLMLVIGYFAPLMPPPKGDGGIRKHYCGHPSSPQVRRLRPRNCRRTLRCFALPVETPGGDALYRVAIPQAVYESAAFPDLRDLRVFNGAGEVVPYAFRPVERTVESRHRLRCRSFHCVARATRGPTNSI